MPAARPLSRSWVLSPIIAQARGRDAGGAAEGGRACPARAWRRGRCRSRRRRRSGRGCRRARGAPAPGPRLSLVARPRIRPAARSRSRSGTSGVASTCGVAAVEARIIRRSRRRSRSGQDSRARRRRRPPWCRRSSGWSWRSARARGRSPARSASAAACAGSPPASSWMKPANQTDQVAWKSKSVPSLSKTRPRMPFGHLRTPRQRLPAAVRRRSRHARTADPCRLPAFRHPDHPLAGQRRLWPHQQRGLLRVRRRACKRLAGRYRDAAGAERVGDLPGRRDRLQLFLKPQLP